MIKIAPSILAADFAYLGEQVKLAQDAGADLIHIDIMDGRFVPNITMGPAIVEAVAKLATIPLDVHLMIVEPDRFVQRFADSGADSITVHVEACTHLHRVLGQINDVGCRPGVALNPHSPASALREVIEMIRIVNVMTVNPGFGGQRFIGGMSGKISELRAMVDSSGSEIEIEVDGGINAATISVAEAAGATIAIAGTCVFQHRKGIAAGIAELRQAAALTRKNACA
ncbi:MAG: ribulose-phosphate 3-epimerase [Chloroflexota bacterium]|nr:ribulose-phosphate 3-epimerase [Chloroflexota bacterium]